MADLPLEVDGLVAGAGREPVLRAFSLRLAAGERAALMGASGSGKSTLLRAIAGFIAPRAGSIRVSGRLVADTTHSIAPARRGVAMVFQSYALWPHLTALEHVRLVADGATAGERWLDRTRIRHLAERLPGELSGGEQARLALARAFASGAALLLLDEPFRNLDPPLAAELRCEIADWLTESGAAALLVTHDPREAVELAQTLHVLIGGRIAASGPPRELLAAPPDASIARLLGVAAAPGALVALAGSSARGTAR